MELLIFGHRDYVIMNDLVNVLTLGRTSHMNQSLTLSHIEPNPPIPRCVTVRAATAAPFYLILFSWPTKPSASSASSSNLPSHRPPRSAFALPQSCVNTVPATRERPDLSVKIDCCLSNFNSVSDSDSNSGGRRKNEPRCPRKKRIS